MSKFQALTDNGLLRSITRMNHYDRYVRFCAGLEKIGISDIGSCNFIVTHSSLLEAVGITLPSIPVVTPDQKLLDNTVAANKTNSKEIGEASDLLRLDIMQKYEQKILGLPELRTEYIEKRLEEQLNYVDDLLKEWFFEIYMQPLRAKDQHEFICNRIALDKMYGHEYPTEIRNLMDTATVVDIIKSVEVGHNLPQGRGLAKLWKSFGESSKKMVIENYKDAEHRSKAVLSLEDTLANIDVASSCFSFKPKEDYLDLDIIHFSVIGRNNESGVHEKVFCLTADPIEKARIRIQMMRSFALQTKDMFGQYIKGFEEKEGVVGFYDLEGNLIQHIDVRKEPRLFERIHNEKIVL